MKAFSRRFICRALILSILALPYSVPAQAALIATDQVVTSAQAQADHDKVRSFAAREDVQKQLSKFGVSPAAAKHRVAALTDDEVQQLAGKIDSLPAGAHGEELGFGAALFLVLVILLLILVLEKR